MESVGVNITSKEKLGKSLQGGKWRQVFGRCCDYCLLSKSRLRASFPVVQFGMIQSAHERGFWSVYGNSSISSHSYVQKPYVVDEEAEQCSSNSQHRQLLAMGNAQCFKIAAWAVPVMPKAVVTSRSSRLDVGLSVVQFISAEMHCCFCRQLISHQSLLSISEAEAFWLPFGVWVSGREKVFP